MIASDWWLLLCIAVTVAGCAVGVWIHDKMKGK